MDDVVESADHSVPPHKKLKVHMTTETGEPPFLCPCGKFKTTLKQYMLAHQSLHELYPDVFTFEGCAVNGND